MFGLVEATINVLSPGNLSPEKLLALHTKLRRVYDAYGWYAGIASIVVTFHMRLCERASKLLAEAAAETAIRLKPPIIDLGPRSMEKYQRAVEWAEGNALLTLAPTRKIRSRRWQERKEKIQKE